MLNDKVQDLHDYLGNQQFAGFDFHGNNCRRFVEMAVIEQLDANTSPYDWLMQLDQEEAIKLVTAYVVSDGKSLHEQDEMCDAFFDAAFECYD